MTNAEIEKEIQARIEFKMNEFKTALKNRLSIKYRQAFDMTRESQYVWQAFEEISEMINKEMRMPTPYDEMANQKKWEAKENAVEKLVKYFDIHGRRDYQVSTVVRIIQEAQDF